MAWIIVAATLAFFVLFPIGVMAWAWGHYGWRCLRPFPTQSRLPEVAVILSLRGADPSLVECLAGVLAQDYPAYQLHIVVDSVEDPANTSVVNEIMRRHAPGAKVFVEVRQEFSERRSLKLSAQRQVLMRLDESVEVVAFLDADVIPSADWLRTLVAPFADPQVGATSGIRWSAPVDVEIGTLARYVFNAVSFPQMYFYRIPWGGSFAVRTSVLHRTSLLDYWSDCFSEDTSAYGPIRAAGFRLAFVPEATQINSERTDLAGAYYFMLRQLVCVRLHHIYWRRMLAVNVATVLAFLSCCLLALFGLLGAVLSLFGITTELWKLTGFAIIPALYGAGVMAALAVGDHLVRRVVDAPRRPVGLLRLGWAILVGLSHATYAIFQAPFIRSIDWRGITYDIEGRNRIRMRAYRAYRGAADAAVAARSVL